MKLVARAVDAAGGRLVPLAPSSRAAKVLGGDLDRRAHTLHSWVHQRGRAADGKTVGKDFRLRPGDVVLVDEAGMAGTLLLDEVLADASRRRAGSAHCGTPCCPTTPTCAPPTPWTRPPRSSSTSPAPPWPSRWPPGSPRPRPLSWRAAVTVAGSLAFATASPARAWQGAPRRRERLGVLRPSAMRPLLLSLVFLGATAGALDVAGIAVAERQDAPWLAGAVPAAFSAAGLLGVILFSRLQPTTASRPRHLMLLGSAYAACWLPLLAPLPAPAVLALALLPGALFVPLLTVASLTVTALAPPGTSTEAVGWMSSAIRLGLAGGTVLAGPLSGHFAIPLVAAVGCALLLAARTAPAATPV